ncbi:uncharacterized protein L199_008295 [Kwoniella botswanensis]|uniref:uncharacterized protein n=1 Tax=Kwoniella botswanensis TaxID=1268659 RepID=UPI00315DF5CB
MTKLILFISLFAAIVIFLVYLYAPVEVQLALFISTIGTFIIEIVKSPRNMDIRKVCSTIYASKNANSTNEIQNCGSSRELIHARRSDETNGTSLENHSIKNFMECTISPRYMQYREQCWFDNVTKFPDHHTPPSPQQKESTCEYTIFRNLPVEDESHTEANGIQRRNAMKVRIPSDIFDQPTAAVATPGGDWIHVPVHFNQESEDKFLQDLKKGLPEEETGYKTYVHYLKSETPLRSSTGQSSASWSYMVDISRQTTLVGSPTSPSRFVTSPRSYTPHAKRSLSLPLSVRQKSNEREMRDDEDALELSRRLTRVNDDVRAEKEEQKLKGVRETSRLKRDMEILRGGKPEYWRRWCAPVHPQLLAELNHFERTQKLNATMSESLQKHTRVSIGDWDPREVSTMWKLGMDRGEFLDMIRECEEENEKVRMDREQDKKRSFSANIIGHYKKEKENIKKFKKQFYGNAPASVQQGRGRTLSYFINKFSNDN